MRQDFQEIAAGGESVWPGLEGLLSVDEVPDKPGHLGARDKGVARWGFIFLDFLSEGQGDFDDKAADSFKQSYDNSYLGENGSTFQAPDFGPGKDAQVVFGGGVGSLRGGPKRLELLMPVGAPASGS